MLRTMGLICPLRLFTAAAGHRAPCKPCANGETVTLGGQAEYLLDAIPAPPTSVPLCWYWPPTHEHAGSSAPRHTQTTGAQCVLTIPPASTNSQRRQRSHQNMQFEPSVSNHHDQNAQGHEPGHEWASSRGGESRDLHEWASPWSWGVCLILPFSRRSATCRPLDPSTPA